MHKTRNCSKHTKKKIQLNVKFLLSGMVTISFLKAYTISVSSIPVVKELYIDFCFELEVSYKNGRAKLYSYFIHIFYQSDRSLQLEDVLKEDPTFQRHFLSYLFQLTHWKQLYDRPASVCAKWRQTLHSNKYKFSQMHLGNHHHKTPAES